MERMRELSKLFCEGLTATQIASITGLSRVTVNNYLKFFRLLITRQCVKDDIVTLNIYKSLHYKNGAEVQLITSHNETIEIIGIIDTGSYLIVNPLLFITAEQLKKKSQRQDDEALEILKSYNAIINLTGKTQYKLINGIPLKKTSNKIIDNADKYWMALQKKINVLRGLQQASAFMHIKETAYRFNNRNHKLYNFIIPLIEAALFNEQDNL